jgi:hypothetical protein
MEDYSPMAPVLRSRTHQGRPALRILFMWPHLPVVLRLPNAGADLLPEAGARQERTLEAVRCSALFGWDASDFAPFSDAATMQQ